MKAIPKGNGESAHVVFETDDGKWIATVKAEFAETVQAALASSQQETEHAAA